MVVVVVVVVVVAEVVVKVVVVVVVRVTEGVGGRGASGLVAALQRWVIAIETKIQLPNTLPIILNFVIGIIN